MCYSKHMEISSFSFPFCFPILFRNISLLKLLVIRILCNDWIMTGVLLFFLEQLFYTDINCYIYVNAERYFAFQAKECIENLEKSLSERKNNEENDRNSLRVPEDSQRRFSGGTPVKDNKMIKQLWDEIAKKDSKVQDLEK